MCISFSLGFLCWLSFLWVFLLGLFLFLGGSNLWCFYFFDFGFLFGDNLLFNFLLSFLSRSGGFLFNNWSFLLFNDFLVFLGVKSFSFFDVLGKYFFILGSGFFFGFETFNLFLFAELLSSDSFLCDESLNLG